MGGLGHYLESQNLATSGISLIRLHTEKIRPPRALWVPFDLGRPLGPPGDVAFQTRVLRTALELLEAPEGPILADFPDDAPSTANGVETPLQACPIGIIPREPSRGSLKSRLQKEMDDLEVGRRGGATASGLSARAIIRFLLGFLETGRLASPKPQIDPFWLIQMAAEDLKAMYHRAREGQTEPLDSSSFSPWFYQETAAGELLWVLRERLSDHPDPTARLVGQLLLVPIEETVRRRNRPTRPHVGISGEPVRRRP